MKQNKEKRKLNFWLEGRLPLVENPDIHKSIQKTIKNDESLKRHYTLNGILPWKKRPEGFISLLHIILAQQISTAVATHLVKRVRTLMPQPSARKFLDLRDADLRAAGLSRQKITYAQSLAEKIALRQFIPALLKKMPDDEAMDMITSLKGFGPWSAETYLMFCLCRGNIWPAGDIALQKSVQAHLGLDTRPNIEETRRYGELWAPYRTGAALILWNT